MRREPTIVGVSDEHCRLESDVLRRELGRIGDLLDDYDKAKEQGVAADGSPLIKRILGQLGDVIRRFRELDEGKWGPTD